MEAAVVIGANFGDEGKGLVTDWLSRPSTLVVRFSGGAQAGHTVVTPEGRRHVFHHFGAGSLRGAATYLGPHFICNPILFHREHQELRWLCSAPTFIDPACLMTTPFDMMINQAVEEARGSSRHGSCGIGINETVTRCFAGFPTYAMSALDSRSLRISLEAIWLRYTPRRLTELGLPPNALGDRDFASILTAYIDDARQMVRSRIATTYDLRGQLFDNVVFEGAQGLGLDEVHGAFPYVTRARTGIDHVLPLARELGASELTVYYVTRAYLTRHGPGLLRESTEAFTGIVDQTNVTNPWQGPLRLGHLDLDGMAERVKRDRAKHGQLSCLVVTCADQIVGQAAAYLGGSLINFESVSDLCRAAAMECRCAILESSGPTRDDLSSDAEFASDLSLL